MSIGSRIRRTELRKANKTDEKVAELRKANKTDELQVDEKVAELRKKNDLQKANK